MFLFFAPLLALPGLTHSQSIGGTCGINGADAFNANFRGPWRIASTGCRISNQFNVHCSYPVGDNSPVQAYTWQTNVQFGPKNGKTCPNSPPVAFGVTNRPNCNTNSHPTGLAGDPPCKYDTCTAGGGDTITCGCVQESLYGIPNPGVKWYCLYSSCNCPAVVNPPGGTGGGGVCFSADTTVQVQDKGVVRMDQLNVGDYVKTSNNKFERVYGFGHRTGSYQEDEYVKIHAEGIKPLTLSAHHMVYVEGNKAVSAAALQIGDKLKTDSGGFAVVHKTESVRGKGAYSPFTESGKIIVNGIEASNYIAFFKSGNLEISSWELPLPVIKMTHAFLAPYRLMCKVNWNWCENATFDENGLSTYLAKPFEMTKWYLKQNAVIMVILLIPLVGFMMLAGSFEFIIMNPAWLVLAMAVWWWNIKNKIIKNKRNNSTAAADKKKKTV